jgi:hypothetical protein
MLPNGMAGVDLHHEHRVSYKSLPEHMITCTNAFSATVGWIGSPILSSFAASRSCHSSSAGTNIFFFPTAQILIFPVVIVHIESKSGLCAFIHMTQSGKSPFVRPFNTLFTFVGYNVPVCYYLSSYGKYRKEWYYEWMGNRFPQTWGLRKRESDSLNLEHPATPLTRKGDVPF